MECTGAQCSFQVHNMAIEGQRVTSLVGLFGVRLGVSCEVSDSLFFSASDITSVEDTGVELGLVDRDKIRDFLLIKSSYYLSLS